MLDPVTTRGTRAKSPFMLWFRGSRQDIRVATRTLRKKPLATVLAVVTLATGIGATTAVFSVLNALAYRDLPVRHPKELVALSVTMGSFNTAGFSVPMLQALARSPGAFSGLIGFAPAIRTNVEIGIELTQAEVLSVTSNFYSDLGVQPAAGRLIVPRDMNLETFTGAPVGVLGYGFWQRWYGGDPSVIGQTIRIDGQPYTIVGIAPRGFTAFSMFVEPDVTIPLAAAASPPPQAAVPGLLWIHLVGRLASGTSIEQARARLTPVWTSIKNDLVPPTYAAPRRANFLSLGLNMSPARTGIAWTDGRSRFTEPLWFMLALAVIVLAISCLNVAGLMLARAAGQTHDIGIRMALGASSWDIRRRAIAEALVLASLGSGFGLIVAQWAAPIIARFMLQEWIGSSLSLRLTPDSHVLAILGAIVISVCVLFGAMPVWQTQRRSAKDLFGGGARIAARIGRLGPILVAGQVALAIVASIDAGLLVRTLQHLAMADPGFTRSNVTVAELLPRPGNPLSSASAVTNAYQRQLLDDIRAATGARGVALSGGVPLNGGDWTRSITTASAPGEPMDVAYDSVSPGFVDVFGLTVREGRDFDWGDNSGRPRVALVSHSLADRLFPGRSAVGQYINLGPTPTGQHIEIVGVMKDVTLYNVKNGSMRMLLVPMLQDPEPSEHSLVLRSPMPSNAALRRAVSSLGREYVFRTRTLDEIAQAATHQEQLAAVVGAAFGGIAVGLAALGLYGLLLYIVSRRTREFAIRVALGGRAWTVMSLVLKQGIQIAAAGMIVGGLVALANVRWLQSFLYGVTLHDALALSIIPIVLVATSVLACAIPAARAAQIDPLMLLREE
jgi:predicted permease